MRKMPIEKHSFVLKAIEKFDDKSFFMSFISEWKNDKYSISKIKSHLNLICDLVTLHGYDSVHDKYNLYWKSGSKDKLLIRYGSNRVLVFEQKLKKRPRPSKPFSVFTKEYWISKGLSNEDAIIKVAEIQSNNAKKRTKSSYDNHSAKIKHSLDYWLAKGYSLEESETLRESYLKPMLGDLNSFIERHGKNKGIKLYNKKIKKYKESCEANKHNRKTAGYVSKESIGFFVKLYKMCRKLGIQRKDIYFGIDGSREFFIRHKGEKNRGRFFDFTIPSLNIIIEYNGVFWHPRHPQEWSNPWVEYNDAVLVEEEKKQLCLDNRYDLFVVWSDDNLDSKLNELFVEVKKRYEK